MKNVSATVDDETHRRLRILYCPSRAASGETETQQHQLVLREPKEESKRRRIGISMPTTCPRKGCTSAMRLADSDTPLYVRQCLPVRRQQERSGHRGPSRQGRPHPLRPSARRVLLPSYKNVPGEQADPRVHRDTQVNTLTARSCGGLPQGRGSQPSFRHILLEQSDASCGRGQALRCRSFRGR